MKKRKGKVDRTIFIVLVLISAIAIGAVVFIYQHFFSPNVNVTNNEPEYIYIHTGSDFDDVLSVFKTGNVLVDISAFEWAARRMHYDENVRPGKYELKPSMNNRDLISLLRSGKQTPVKVTFNNIRNVEQLAGRISQLIEADSASIVKIFKDSAFQHSIGFTVESGIAVVIPNTYEFYWTTSAEKFHERMLKEYDKFWNEQRMTRLNEIGLGKTDVSVIASIVEQETRKDDEKKVIAGVYVNRYKKGWKLEADPTLIFALGDFTIRRVLNEHKGIESPYNTYLYKGLPPGPICIPGIASIDAVLYYAEHEYMYFCAKDDFSGYHAFAKTYIEHLLNARKFQRALTRRGIMS